MNAKRKIIIDQDAHGPASTNLQSILMLLQAPEVEVLGICVVSGDGWCDENVAHTLRLLEIAGRTDVPVLRGAALPLLNSQRRMQRWEGLHGLCSGRAHGPSACSMDRRAPGRIPTSRTSSLSWRRACR
ncbi:nucleoside hydrolase [Variovorax rhizosphaerae]|uniref:Nucleoside hydrolase n=1 Tax=Variovorax rhizosphaerae TaxID=1836200 RepID=A0ABU8WMB9_9BURK